ncbi:MAG: hypothetical protein KTR18_10255 [Acidiferrobacterales bacterium]|nr:hypothetical protein [Acidiferrobacterales bacterium]
MENRYRIGILAIFLVMTGCGGGGETTTGGAGAPLLTSKCTINNLTVSSGTEASLNKATSQLSVDLTLTLQSASNVDITTNFENASADDWIEGYPFIQDLGGGDHAIALTFDLNSPEKNSADRYTKLSVTARLPGNEACVANLPVNITLNP